MSTRSYLGELELMILLAVIHLGDDAYGVPLRGLRQLSPGVLVSSCPEANRARDAI